MSAYSGSVALTGGVRCQGGGGARGRKIARECPQQRRALPDIAQYRADMSI